MLIVLVGLNGDGGQCGIAGNALGLPQIAMAGGKASVEQPDDINLTAGGGQRIEVEIVDMDIALPIGLGVLGTKEIDLVIGLCTGSADLQHGAHGSVAVDVGVVPLHVAGPGVDVGDFINGLHQHGIGFPDAGAVGAIQNICFCGGIEAMVHELLLYRILNGLDIRGGVGVFCLEIRLNCIGNPGGIGSVAFAGCFQRLEYSGCDFALLIEHHATIAFDNTLNHTVPSFPTLSHVAYLWWIEPPDTISSVSRCFAPLYFDTVDL